jgi:hypothetical protein
MDAMQGQAMAIETQRRREIQLRRIDSAATLCITCASRQEKR